MNATLSSWKGHAEWSFLVVEYEAEIAWSSVYIFRPGHCTWSPSCSFPFITELTGAADPGL